MRTDSMTREEFIYMSLMTTILQKPKETKNQTKPLSEQVSIETAIKEVLYLVRRSDVDRIVSYLKKMGHSSETMRQQVREHCINHRLLTSKEWLDNYVYRVMFVDTFPDIDGEIKNMSVTWPEIKEIENIQRRFAAILLIYRIQFAGKRNVNRFDFIKDMLSLEK